MDRDARTRTIKSSDLNREAPCYSPLTPSSNTEKESERGLSDDVRRLTLSQKLLTRKLLRISLRLSISDFEYLENIMRVRGIENISEAIREAVRVYGSLLSGAGRVQDEGVGPIVIENPIINIVSAEAKSESKSEARVTNIDITAELVNIIQKLYRLRDPLPPLQKSLIEKLYRIIEKFIHSEGDVDG